MIHPAPSNDEKKQNLKDAEYLEVDEYLGHVGRFGRFQIFLLLLFCCIIFPSTYQTLVMSFAGNIHNYIFVTFGNSHLLRDF